MYNVFKARQQSQADKPQQGRKNGEIMTKVTCNASGFVMDINEEIKTEYRANGWDLPEDFDLADDAVTWVNGDYHKAVEDATWPEHLPYWEAGAELF